MNIKISTVLHNVYGDPLKSQRVKPQTPKEVEEKKPKEKEDLTLKDVVVNALLAEFPDEKDLTGENKLMRYRLAMKIMDAKIEVDLVAEEIVLIKGLVAKAYASIVAGQAWQMLESKN